MSKERPLQLAGGFAMLATVIFSFLFCIALFIGGILLLERREPLGGWAMAGAVFFFVCTMITCNGFVILLPNEAAVMTLFGSYVGTAKESGFWWTNPFMTKRKLSLRSRNLEGGKLKVNDKQGNPIEIAAVVVWQHRGHRPGLLRRRELRDLRAHPERDGRAASGQFLRLRSWRGKRDHAPQRRR